nr:replication protein [Escherichia coli]
MGVVKLADYRPQLEVVEHRVADTEDGFMRVANEITDSLLMADLTVRQLKVMLAIMRKTYGFNKPMDRLTNTQIAAMTVFITLMFALPSASLLSVNSSLLMA